jgi:hypothetical protein
VIVLQDSVLVTLGGCHLLDGLLAPLKHQGYCVVLLERVIELQHLRVVSWCSERGGRLEILAQESSSCRSTQQGLAWWQPSEAQDKNHRGNIVYSS